MRKWLFLLFHNHEWKIIKSVAMCKVHGSTGMVISEYTLHTQECKICGKLQATEVG